jgi:hypothetical protein
MSRAFGLVTHLLSEYITLARQGLVAVVVAPADLTGAVPFLSLLLPFKARLINGYPHLVNSVGTTVASEHPVHEMNVGEVVDSVSLDVLGNLVVVERGNIVPVHGTITVSRGGRDVSVKIGVHYYPLEGHAGFGKTRLDLATLSTVIVLIVTIAGTVTDAEGLIATVAAPDFTILPRLTELARGLSHERLVATLIGDCLGCEKLVTLLASETGHPVRLCGGV